MASTRGCAGISRSNAATVSATLKDLSGNVMWETALAASSAPLAVCLTPDAIYFRPAMFTVASLLAQDDAESLDVIVLCEERDVAPGFDRLDPARRWQAHAVADVSLRRAQQARAEVGAPGRRGKGIDGCAHQKLQSALT